MISTHLNGTFSDKHYTLTVENGVITSSAMHTPIEDSRFDYNFTGDILHEFTPGQAGVYHPLSDGNMNGPLIVVCTPEWYAAETKRQRTLEIRLLECKIQDKRGIIEELWGDIRALDAQIGKLMTADLHEQHGLSYGDELAITPEFIALMYERDWFEHQVENFTTVKTLFVGNNVGDGVASVSTGSCSTGDVPISMIKAMREAWLKAQETPAC